MSTWSVPASVPVRSSVVIATAAPVEKLSAPPTVLPVSPQELPALQLSVPGIETTPVPETEAPLLLA